MAGKVRTMIKNFEDVQKIGKDNMDASMKSFGAVSKSFQAIAVEAADYAKKAFEEGTAATEKLAAAKSLDKVMEVQADYLKSAVRGFRRAVGEGRPALCRSRAGALQAVREPVGEGDRRSKRAIQFGKARARARAFSFWHAARSARGPATGTAWIARLALLWQIYSRCCSLQIHFRQ